jgi:hypothetical protein
MFSFFFAVCQRSTSFGDGRNPAVGGEYIPKEAGNKTISEKLET